MQTFKQILLLTTLFSLLQCSVAEIQWSKQETGRTIWPWRPHRLVETPLFFAEVQNYRLVENYLSRWIDRPLFHDSSLRGHGSYAESTGRNIELGREYSLDGFTVLGSAKLFPEWERILKHLEQKKYSDFQGMMGMSYPDSLTPRFYERFLRNYKASATSPHTLRIDGKIVVWSYGSAYFPNKAWDELRKRIKAEKLPPPFFFANPQEIKWKHEIYAKKGYLTPSEREMFKKTLEEQLRHCDGFVFHHITGQYRPPRASYASRAITDPFYRDYTLPILLELYSRKEFCRKGIGSYVYKGYTNHMSGNINGQYGSTAFRIGMEETFKLNPDIIVFFEWNEANENTHYQPTVSTGRTFQRITRSYMDLVRKNSPGSEKNDDLTIPNLIFSSPHVIKTGDNLRFELLNLPDMTQKLEYETSLILKDRHGKLLWQAPAETFDRSVYKSVTYTLPSTQFSSLITVHPEFSITGTDGTKHFYQFRHVRLDPSVCTNYNDVFQPIREYLPCHFDFQIKNGCIQAKAQSPEPLRAFELVCNERETAAARIPLEIPASQTETIIGYWNAHIARTKSITFEVKNSPDWSFRRDNYRSAPDDLPVIRNQKAVIRNYFVPYYYPEHFFITYKKSPDARLVIHAEGLPAFTLSCAELEKQGRYAKVYPGGIKLDLKMVRRQEDIFSPLNQRKASLQYTFDTTQLFPSTLELRAIGMDGRIRRKFIGILNAPGNEKLNFPVLDVNEKKGVCVKIPASLRRNLQYHFSPQKGDLLYPPGYPEFTGELGGGYLYCEPFCYCHDTPLLPDMNGKTAAPAWKQENKQWTLHFNGISNYINFPAETLPYGAFTLKFTIRPTDSMRHEVLFRTVSSHYGSVNLFRHHDKLAMVYTRYLGVNRTDLIKVPTELEIPAGQWSAISIASDLESFRFTVNGKSRKIPFPYQGYFFKPCIFGGSTYPAYVSMDPQNPPQFFKGDLNALQIIHGIENFQGYTLQNDPSLLWEADFRSSRKNNIKLKGNAAVQDGILRLDGKSGYGTIPDSTGMHLTERGMTLIVKIRPEDNGSGGTAPENLDMYICKQNEFLLGRMGEKLYFNFHNGKQWTASTTASILPQPGKWHTVAAVIENITPDSLSQPSYRISLHLNGKLLTRNFVGTQTCCSGNHPVNIGHAWDGWGKAWLFHGDIAKAAIYQRPLSISEITKLCPP